MSAICVVKLGGSLLDLPDLGPRLRARLDDMDSDGSRVAVVVGGGPTTDAVRTLDRLHGLGEAVSHDLALRGLALNAHAVRALLGRGEVVSHVADLAATPLAILDPWGLLDELECAAGGPLLPHTWNATSDSVALVLAAALGARTLLLLKSVGPAGPLDPGGRHPMDVVDPCFVGLWRARPDVRVEVVPFRV